MKYLSSPEHTTDAEMWYYLGREHYRFGDLDSAIDCFKKMDQFTYLNYTDIYVDGMFVLAQCYYLMNKIDETRRALGQALSINPNFSKAMELISRVNPSWTKFWELTDDSNVIIKRKSVSIMDDREIRRRVAQLATIPEREGKLKQCLDSIIPFVDEVRVMLNNYDRVPAWMEKMETVVPVLRKNQKGDAEKFYKVEDLKDTIIFILDDDLVYNEVFFNSCHDATIRYRCPVGYHGRINGKKFKAVDTNQMIRNVEFMIPDSLCFTSDDCNITYKHFTLNDTASFTFSEYCHKNKINMLVLPHYKLRKI